MKKFLKSYKSTIILLAAIIIGAIVGIVLQDKAAVLKPFGDIFLNLMFIVIVPLIFFSITSSIAKMKQPKRIGKVMISIVVAFIITSLIAVFVGVFSTFKTSLVDVSDGEQIKSSLTTESEETEEDSEEEEEEPTILERTVDVLTVNDFQKLLSRNNIIAIIVVSIMVGIAIHMAGDKAEAFEKFIYSGNEVIMNLVKIIMYYAPIGLGCYIAALIGTFGSTIAVGYLKTFVIYTVVCLAFYMIVYSLYAFIAGGVKGLKAYWKNILTPTVTALGTCSSAASIPANADAAKKIGVSDDIAETMIPLGTSFHKDGSIIGSVFKIMFLVCLFGTSPSLLQVIGVALIANLLITGVPIGGGTISEMMIITMMGFPVAALPILTIIATVIDAPATVLNVIGDSASSMLVARVVDGKDWMDKKKENTKSETKKIKEKN